MKKTPSKPKKKLMLTSEKVRDLAPAVTDDKLKNVAGGGTSGESGSISHMI